VAVYSDADMAALYVGEADEAVHLRGNAAAHTYLLAEGLIGAAESAAADAVHPGYGFLSENASFAASCAAAGLVFIGPSPEAIRQMGDKLGAKAIMAANGVPTLASFTLGAESDHDGDIDSEGILATVGLPAIIKASAGGGGRGMRIVTDVADFDLAIDSARREARSAFGDATLFIERYVAPARHIEVQVVADCFGRAAALFERECSIQRRHQKVVEEAPSPFVDEQLRSSLMDAAMRAVKAVDYLGVGTVEFVVGADGTVAFLEMNTRLQVEHPVTELITDVDLVRLQFQIAAGDPLPTNVVTPTIRGHAIEARICAEDPAAGYTPASGTFSTFDIGGIGVRVDTGVSSGSDVPPYYDSMVAKVIAHGETRQEAASRLARALETARLHGVTTNRDLLVRILRSEEFLSGDTTTDFLDRVTGLTESITSDSAWQCHAVAAAIAINHAHQQQRVVQTAIPPGWRNNPAGPESLELAADLAGTRQVFKIEHHRSGPTSDFSVDGAPVDVGVHTIDGVEGGYCLAAAIGGIRRNFRVDVSADRISVDSIIGSTEFFHLSRFPTAERVSATGGLAAPMPGTVVRIFATVGQVVAAGQPLMVLEAMKMEHTITSPSAGQIAAVHVSEGDQVDAGVILASVDAHLPEDQAP
jgi:acetyl/propionyl-CoA carboxylase alpha subunit